jgi:hypothetical protein
MTGGEKAAGPSPHDSTRPRLALRVGSLVAFTMSGSPSAPSPWR